MRILGNDATVADFKLDLVHLRARLRADSREAVKALAPRVSEELDALVADQSALEDAEIADVEHHAILTARDGDFDATERNFALATKLDASHDHFFSKPVSTLTRAPIADELETVQKQLGLLAERDAADPLRAAWQPKLEAAHHALEAARVAEQAGQRDLALVRSALARRKAHTDQLRVSVWSALVQILGDRSTADSYFRAKVTTPKATPSTPAPAT